MNCAKCNKRLEIYEIEEPYYDLDWDALCDNCFNLDEPNLSILADKCLMKINEAFAILDKTDLLVSKFVYE